MQIVNKMKEMKEKEELETQESQELEPVFVIVKEVVTNSETLIYFDDSEEFFDSIAGGATVFVNAAKQMYCFGEGIVYIYVGATPIDI